MVGNFNLHKCFLRFNIVHSLLLKKPDTLQYNVRGCLRSAKVNFKFPTFLSNYVVPGLGLIGWPQTWHTNQKACLDTEGARRKASYPWWCFCQIYTYCFADLHCLKIWKKGIPAQWKNEKNECYILHYVNILICDCSVIAYFFLVSVTDWNYMYLVI